MHGLFTPNVCTYFGGAMNLISSQYEVGWSSAREESRTAIINTYYPVTYGDVAEFPAACFFHN